MITEELFEKAMTYREYRALIDRLLEQGRTTGTDHSESMLEYTRLNVHRMNRLDKTISLDDALTHRLKNLRCKLKWLVISEAWCGDAAQNLPILNKMAEASSNIELKILLRDEHPQLMDNYLTNGSRAIPKLIILDDKMNELATWGPRPATVQQMVMENKATGRLPYAEFAKVVQKWYAKDKGRSLQHEIMELLGKLNCDLDEQH